MKRLYGLLLLAALAVMPMPSLGLTQDDVDKSTEVIQKSLDALDTVLSSVSTSQTGRDLMTQTQKTILGLSVEQLEAVPGVASLIISLAGRYQDTVDLMNGDITKASVILANAQDGWNIAFALQGSFGLEPVEAGSTFFTPMGAGNVVLGVQMFVVSSTLNMELGLADQAISAIDGAMAVMDRAFNGYFSNTEKAIVNDYADVAGAGLYGDLMRILRENAGIASYVPKENYGVTDFVTQYPYLIVFWVDRNWVLAADSRIVPGSPDFLEIAAWAYTPDAGGAGLPDVSLECQVSGNWTTIPIPDGFWNTQSGNVRNLILYGPKGTYSVRLPLTPASSLPAAYRLKWAFPGDNGQVFYQTVRTTPTLAVSSPAMVDNTIVCDADASMHCAVPITLTVNGGSVQNLQWNMTGLSTATTPQPWPVPFINPASTTFSSFPSSLSGTWSGTLDIAFPAGTAPGVYYTAIRITAPGAAPTDRRIAITLPAPLLTPTPLDLEIISVNTSGSGNNTQVQVSYRVRTSLSDSFSVSLTPSASSDGGNSWNVGMRRLSGDLTPTVSTSWTTHSFTWQAGYDWPEDMASNFKVRLTPVTECWARNTDSAVIDIEGTQDGNWLVLTSNRVQKINSNGILQWSGILTAGRFQRVVESDQKHVYAVSADSSTGYLWKLTQNGDVLNQTILESKYVDLAPAPGDGVYLKLRSVLHRLDSSGAIVWSKSSVSNFDVTDDGRLAYILGTNLCLLRLDGTTEWLFSRTGVRYLSQVQSSGTAGFFVSDYISGEGWNLWAVTLNGTWGDLLWHDDAAYPKTLEETSDSACIIITSSSTIHRVGPGANWSRSNNQNLTKIHRNMAGHGFLAGNTFGVYRLNDQAQCLVFSTAPQISTSFALDTRTPVPVRELLSLVIGCSESAAGGSTPQITAQATFSTSPQVMDVTSYASWTPSLPWTAPIATNSSTYSFYASYTYGGLTAEATRSIMVPGSDSDSDGLPDDWMYTHFGHSTASSVDLSRPDDDPDQDGQCNLDEYIAGTDPKSEASLFKIDSIIQQSSELTLNWPSMTGRIYTVWWTDQLGQWKYSRRVSGGHYTDWSSSSVTSRFYKISVDLP